jgi:hypothetical protein
MAVAADDDAAARLSERDVHGRRHDLGRVVEQADARVALGVLGDDLARPVGAAPVDAEHLYVVRRDRDLRQHGIRARGHKPLFVPHRDDNGHEHDAAVPSAAAARRADWIPRAQRASAGAC